MSQMSLMPWMRSEVAEAQWKGEKIMHNHAKVLSPNIKLYARITRGKANIKLEVAKGINAISSDTKNTCAVKPNPK